MNFDNESKSDFLVWRGEGVGVQLGRSVSIASRRRSDKQAVIPYI